MTADTPAELREAAARRTAFLEAETGINEAMIEQLVRGFYDRVRNDDLIGPVFASKITDWEPHLQQMFAFWSSVTLMTGRYHGQPMRKHLRLPVDHQHFDRWLALFEQTARELCPPKAAEIFLDRARRIAESFEMGVATANGVMLAPKQRLVRKDIENS